MCASCIKNNTQQIAVETPPTPSDDEPLMPNACNPEGTTALHAAAMYGRSELVPLLICAGSKLNIRTTGRGATPLHLACQNKRTSTVSALLDVPGCDINAQDSMGNTPLHYACLSGSAPLVQLLLKFSPNLQLRNVQGKTPLVEAEDRMALRMVQLLRGQLLVPN
jgi:ankyrin repeat protein